MPKIETFNLQSSKINPNTSNYSYNNNKTEYNLMHDTAQSIYEDTGNKYSYKEKIQDFNLTDLSNRVNEILAGIPGQIQSEIGIFEGQGSNTEITHQEPIIPAQPEPVTEVPSTKPETTTESKTEEKKEETTKPKEETTKPETTTEPKKEETTKPETTEPKKEETTKPKEEKKEEPTTSKTKEDRHYFESGDYKSYDDNSLAMGRLTKKEQDIVYEKAEKYNLDPALVMAVMEQESTCDKNIGLNSSNCGGLMQVNQTYYPHDYNDVATNVDYGCMILSNHMKRYNGDEAAALTAYIVGHDNGNRNYANQVLARKRKYEKALNG